MIVVLVGIALVAAVSTIGDYVWFEYGVEHQVLVGILHGAVLLASVGGVIGASAGRTAAGIPVGAAAGIGGALVTTPSSPPSAARQTPSPWSSHGLRCGSSSRFSTDVCSARRRGDRGLR